MTSAVIVDAVRSPMGRGKPNGALASVHSVDLLGQVLRGLLDRTGIDAGTVDDVIIGCVDQVADQAAGVGRFAWLAAGGPEHVPAVTIDRRCGSSQQAAHFAAQGVIAGAYDIVIAGGVESMSRIPIGTPRMGKDPFGPMATERYAPGFVPQGVSAELIANKWGLSRTRLDDYSARSHQRAASAQQQGLFTDEIVPINVTDGDGTVRAVEQDESIRPETTVDTLAALRLSFKTDEAAARFPDLDWTVTAGNSSQVTDGASAMLIMSEERAHRLGLRPRARFHSFAVTADDPIMMLTAPIPATERVLERAKLGVEDIDLFEVNEAFASVVLAWLAETGVDEGRVNRLGGAISLGHPLGATGARLMTTMLGELERSSGRFALQTMCEGGGMANATILERL